MKSILVTGGSGFIGANFLRYLLNKDSFKYIINVDSLSYCGDESKNKELSKKHECYKFLNVDITDTAKIRKIIDKYKVDTVVHFAAESHVDNSIKNAEPFVLSNVLGTHSLLSACVDVWKNDFKVRFHHVSTDEVFGSLNINDPGFKETDIYNPKNPYSASKASSDHFVNAFFNTYNLPVTISHCCNNYGPYQHEEKLIPLVIKSILHRTSIPVYGNGQNIREWSYVVDHCASIYDILHRGVVGQAYNIGSGIEVSNINLIRMICQKMSIILNISVEEIEDLITFVTNRLGHDFRYRLDCSKIHQDLNSFNKTTLDEGLDLTIPYYITKAR